MESEESSSTSENSFEMNFELENIMRCSKKRKWDALIDIDSFSDNVGKKVSYEQWDFDFKRSEMSHNNPNAESEARYIVNDHHDISVKKLYVLRGLSHN